MKCQEDSEKALDISPVLKPLKEWFDSHTNRLLVALSMAFLVPLLLSAYFMAVSTEKALLAEQQRNLFSTARLLDLAVSGTFDDILRQQGRTSAGRDTRIAVINRELQPFMERVVLANPGLEAGYYAHTVKAIVAYGPGEGHANEIGYTPLPEYPGIKSMELGLPMVITETRSGKAVTMVFQPMIRNGGIIGYIWISQLTYDTQSQLAILQRRLGLIVAIAAFVGYEIISRLVKSKQVNRQVSKPGSQDINKIETR